MTYILFTPCNTRATRNINNMHIL